MNPKIVLGAVLVAATLVGGFSFWNPQKVPAPHQTLAIDVNSGNYGSFIDSPDNSYFSTNDQNIRKIIGAYLTDKNPNATTDAEKYGYFVVYFYNKDIFIAGEKHYPDGPVTAYEMRDTKTGQAIGNCTIFSSAGLYKDKDLLLSVTYKDNGLDLQQGACLYERGSSNFTFVDLTSKLGANEVLFRDPSGRDLEAVVENVNTRNKTFSVRVYDMENMDALGKYRHRKSLDVTY